VKMKAVVMRIMVAVDDDGNPLILDNGEPLVFTRSQNLVSAEVQNERHA
jgi:hypothetical protein